jgi:hypothetical protein
MLGFEQVMIRWGSYGRETNYYGIINNILNFNFARNKELKLVFYYDWFYNNHGTRHNQVGMVEVNQNEQLHGYNSFVHGHQVEQVYYMSYPCEKLNAWWVVHKVNPHEHLYTPGDIGYHDIQVLDDEIDVVYKKKSHQPLSLSSLVQDSMT